MSETRNKTEIALEKIDGDLEITGTTKIHAKDNEIGIIGGEI